MSRKSRKTKSRKPEPQPCTLEPTLPPKPKPNATEPPPEPFTLAEYMSVARSFLWVANQAIAQMPGSSKLPEDQKDLCNHLARMIQQLDADKYLSQQMTVPIVGTCGLPPNPAIIKMATLIIEGFESDRPDGGFVVFGSSGFSVRPRVVQSRRKAG